ncbi:dual specificity protein phosphatase family protein [Patescibacteria group bacterium]|nr:dual specificity protein phosphatase family protein [Patescibacteria group bacterium]MBU0963631.1 dual specificity protein phosphatase family protein [Patescibacteria group bacterium]
MKKNIGSKSHKIKHLEYSQVDKYIYIGTTICCRVHFNKLIEMGIMADIDLQEEKMDRPSGVTAFLWLPTIDFTSPSQAQLIIGSHFIEDLVKSNMKCYVHCNAGHGRAPILVAAYYILNKKMGVMEAINEIKKKRSLVHPTNIQIKALKVFKKHLNTS